MAIIKPFKAIRPSAGKVAKVSSHAVERYSQPVIQEILENNPDSFLQVIYAARTLKDNYTEQLHGIKNKFEEFREKGIFEQDSEPCLYIYKQVKDGRSHLGIIALASVEEYEKGVIKIHEQTLAEREKKLKEYLTICDFNAEPVCLTHPYHNELHQFLLGRTKSKSLYNFTVTNIEHSVWKLSDSADVSHVMAIFSSMPNLYIADGHHRAASSALLANTKKQSNTTHIGKEAYNFFMAAFFADTELTIFNFDRMVSSLNNHTQQSLFSELQKTFDISPPSKEHRKPSSAKEMGLYIEGQWYLLKIKEGVNTNADPVNSLDVSVLSNFILGPILNITDLRNDKRIAFIPGVKDIEEMQKSIDSGKMKAAFCLYPISFEELKAVADIGKEMPPKSTWIEPKFESGLLVYSLNN